ncbi:MAG: anhydro-N-acetylmuramic acid kinase [bacterium]|nr:anhydro-N-acetylmuramic acid kinase [bacterium]
MAMSKIYTAIGLMSGTSMDGIDAAIIKTDGEDVVKNTGQSLFRPYLAAEKQLIAKEINGVANMQEPCRDDPQLSELAAIITNANDEAISLLAEKYDLELEDHIDVIGFHGQTVLHRPEQQLTMQLGDGDKLANRYALPVVANMRQADIKAGGQGAPLVPIYHQALVKQAGLELPVAILNVGGVANVTYIGESGELIAFDTGPGNALIDDWVVKHGAGDMDEGGKFAAQGSVKESVLSELINNSYFSQKPPKSLDRNHFSLAPLEGMSLERGAMTLTSFTALAISRADFFFPAPPKKWVICGGGVRNPILMKQFHKRLSGEVLEAGELGWSSDYMEAEAFAYLAVRSLRGLPLTFPGTTGVRAPLAGGVIHMPHG